jgi:hypothetical protein
MKDGETDLLAELVKSLEQIIEAAEYITHLVYNPDSQRYAKEVLLSTMSHRAYFSLLLKSCRDVDSSAMYPSTLPTFPISIVEFYNKDIGDVDACAMELMSQLDKRVASRTETVLLKQLIQGFQAISSQCDKWQAHMRHQALLEVCFMMKRISHHHLLRLNALFQASLQVPFHSPLLADKPTFNQVISPSIPRCRD